MRKDILAERLASCDKEINEFISCSSISEKAKDNLLNRWQVCIHEDITKVKAKWEKKMIGMRNAFSRDYEFYLANQINRLPTHDNIPTHSTSDIHQSREKSDVWNENHTSIDRNHPTTSAAASARPSSEKNDYSKNLRSQPTNHKRKLRSSTCLAGN